MPGYFETNNARWNKILDGIVDAKDESEVNTFLNQAASERGINKWTGHLLGRLLDADQKQFPKIKYLCRTSKDIEHEFYKHQDDYIKIFYIILIGGALTPQAAQLKGPSMEALRVVIELADNNALSTLSLQVFLDIYAEYKERNDGQTLAKMRQLDVFQEILNDRHARAALQDIDPFQNFGTSSTFSPPSFQSSTPPAKSKFQSGSKHGASGFAAKHGDLSQPSGSGVQKFSSSTPTMKKFGSSSSQPQAPTAFGGPPQPAQNTGGGGPPPPPAPPPPPVQAPGQGLPFSNDIHRGVRLKKTTTNPRKVDPALAGRVAGDTGQAQTHQRGGAQQLQDPGPLPQRGAGGHAPATGGIDLGGGQNRLRPAGAPRGNVPPAAAQPAPPAYAPQQPAPQRQQARPAQQPMPGPAPRGAAPALQRAAAAPQARGAAAPPPAQQQPPRGHARPGLENEAAKRQMEAQLTQMVELENSLLDQYKGIQDFTVRDTMLGTLSDLNYRRMELNENAREAGFQLRAPAAAPVAPAAPAAVRAPAAPVAPHDHRQAVVGDQHKPAIPQRAGNAPVQAAPPKKTITELLNQPAPVKQAKVDTTKKAVPKARPKIDPRKGKSD